MRGGGHRVLLALAAAVFVAGALAAAAAPPQGAEHAPAEVAAGGIEGTGVTLAATRAVPVSGVVAVFADPEPAALRDSAAFVDRVYADLVGRPAGEPGRSQWIERLDLAGPRTALTTALTGSEEYRRITVAGLYREYLDRAASSAEVSGWTTRLAEGRPVVWLRVQLLASSEYLTRRAARDDGRFVDAVYGDVLGRAPDDRSRSHWVERLRAGIVDRAWLATYLLESGEGRRARVAAVFERLLARGPSDPEATHWATLLSRGLPEEDVVGAVAASSEYFGRLPSDYAAVVDWGDGSAGPGAVRRGAGGAIEVVASHAYASTGSYTVSVELRRTDGATSSAVSTVTVEAPSNERFVDAMYRELLGRAADAAGMDAWMQELTAGGHLARERAAMRLQESGERRRLVARDLYGRYLARAPSEAEVAGAAEQLATEHLDTVRARLIGSSEYLRTRSGGTTTGFVDAVFRDVLGRPPDPANRTRLVEMLAAGTGRAAVAELLLSTSEARRRAVDGHYRVVLDRAPRADESAHWVAALARGVTEQQLIAALVSSSEYFGRFPPAGSSGSAGSAGSAAAVPA